MMKKTISPDTLQDKLTKDSCQECSDSAQELRAAIEEGLSSGIVEDFDTKAFLQEMKARKTVRS